MNSLAHTVRTSALKFSLEIAFGRRLSRLMSATASARRVRVVVKKSAGQKIVLPSTSVVGSSIPLGILSLILTSMSWGSATALLVRSAKRSKAPEFLTSFTASRFSGLMPASSYTTFTRPSRRATARLASSSPEQDASPTTAAIRAIARTCCLMSAPLAQENAQVTTFITGLSATNPVHDVTTTAPSGTSRRSRTYSAEGATHAAVSENLGGCCATDRCLQFERPVRVVAEGCRGSTPAGQGSSDPNGYCRPEAVVHSDHVAFRKAEVGRCTGSARLARGVLSWH